MGEKGIIGTPGEEGTRGRIVARRLRFRSWGSPEHEAASGSFALTRSKS